MYRSKAKDDVNKLVSSLMEYDKALHNYDHEEKILNQYVDSAEKRSKIEAVHVHRAEFKQQKEEEFDKAIKAIIQREREDSEAALRISSQLADPKKTLEQQLRLNNAVAIISSMGKELDAKTLHDIGKPFYDAEDYTGLRIVKRVAAKHRASTRFIESANGEKDPLYFGEMPGEELEFLQQLPGMFKRAYDGNGDGTASLVKMVIDNHYKEREQNENGKESGIEVHIAP